MNVMIIEQDKEPYTERIWNDLESLRKRIGNDNIEVVEYDKETLLIYDADALSNNLPINRYLDGLAIRGTFILAGNNQKELDFTSLTEEQIEEYTEMLSLDREEELEL
ncbi:MAG: DUF3846 domain-containing protein [Bacilli bacterium]